MQNASAHQSNVSVEVTIVFPRSTPEKRDFRNVGIICCFRRDDACTSQTTLSFHSCTRYFPDNSPRTEMAAGILATARNAKGNQTREISHRQTTQKALSGAYPESLRRPPTFNARRGQRWPERRRQRSRPQNTLIACITPKNGVSGKWESLNSVTEKPTYQDLAAQSRLW